MAALQRYLLNQIPVWARPNNPVLRYTLQRFERRQGWLPRWLSRGLTGLALAAVLALSYQAYRAGAPLLVSGAHTSALFAVLYFPILLMQFAVLQWALVLTSSVLPGEQQRGTWEPLKITSHGAEMVMRAHWAAVFYQLRWVLIGLLAPRVIFAGQMLIDLTDYQGRHLDLYMMGIHPTLPTGVGVLLLAAFLTAALLQLIVAVGLNAAVGLFISTVFHDRRWAYLAQTFAIVGQIVVFVLAVAAGLSVLGYDASMVGQPGRSAAGQWASLLVMAGVGDHSLRLMDLRTLLQTWPGIDYGVFLGAAILVTMLVQAVFTNGLLEWAARRAARPT